jgi:peptidoglycan/LPS O-acetylase OafA/YrhL
MPELDSIRGVAIVSVVIYHGFYLALPRDNFSHWQRLFLTVTWPGRLGVNLFFVLSGFLITGILLDSKLRPNYFRRFYAHRALRILPVYLLVLAVLALLHYPPVFLLLSLLYLSNLTPLMGIGIAYPVLWSLAVEEHFYLVWPMIVRYVSRNALLALSIAIIVTSPFLRYASSFSAHDFTFNEYTWNSADGLACGAVLALLVRMRRNDRKFLLGVVGVSLALAAAFARFAVLPRATHLGAALQITPWHFLFTGMIASCLLIGSSRWKWLVQISFLQFFGRISYGLYLIHFLLYQEYDHYWSPVGFWDIVRRFIYAMSAATALAWLSRTYFEQRLLDLKSR